MISSSNANSRVILRWSRKLSILGKSARLSIPPEFLAANGLTFKDYVDIELLSDGSLRVVPRE